MRSKEISFHAGAPASSAPTATDRNSKLGVRQGGRPSYTQWLQMSPPVRLTNQTSVKSDNSCLWRTKQSTEPRPDPLSRTSQLPRGGRPRTSRPAPT